MVAGLPPVAMELQKHIMQHVKVAAEEQAKVQMSQMAQQQPMDQASADLQYNTMVAQFIAQGMQQVKQLSGELSGAGQPDPLVQLKEQELQLKAQQQQANQQKDQADLQLDQETLKMRDRQFYDRMQSQEQQTASRIDAGYVREMLKQNGNPPTQ